MRCKTEEFKVEFNFVRYLDNVISVGFPDYELEKFMQLYKDSVLENTLLHKSFSLTNPIEELAFLNWRKGFKGYYIS